MAQTNNQGFTLTKATKVGRSFVKWGSITLVFLIFGRITWQAAVAYYKAMNPEPPPPPTQGFGLLPQIEFPEITEEPTSYKLEMARNRLPQFGDRAVVYFMPKKSPSLLDTDTAKTIARSYGFSAEPEKLNAGSLRWRRTQQLNITFDLELITHNFEYKTDYMSRPELILNTSVPTQFDAVQEVKTFLETGELLPGDVATASGKVTYLKAVGGELKEAVSVSDAQFVQVDLNRANLNNKFPIYTPDGETGTIHAILSAGVSGNKIVELQRRYYPIDYIETHTYPLRSTESAWSILQSGEGYIANPGQQDMAVIREVELGYFESFEQQDYLQPIFVFKGDGGFIGYVPAIVAESIQPSKQ